MNVIDLDPVPLLSADEIIRQLVDNLSQLDRVGDRILMICEDVTRSTPIAQFFPQFLQFLNPQTRQISVVFALGTHRPMTRDEMLEKLGFSESEAGAIELFNHDALDENQLIQIGEIDGVPVKLNRALSGADLVISMGSVFPHRVVGFSGGAKYLCPGVANRAIIDYTHWKSNLFPTDEIMAKVDNPIREILHRIGELAIQKFSATFLSVNFVTLPAGIVGLFVGDLFSSYHKASELSAKFFLKSVAPCEKVLAIVDDKSADFWQAAKAVYNCGAIVKDGGTLVVRGTLKEGISSSHGEIIETFGYAIPETIQSWVNSGQLNNPLVASHMIRVGQYLQRIKVILSAEGISYKTCDRVNLGYRDPATIKESEFDCIVHHATDLILTPYSSVK